MAFHFDNVLHNYYSPIFSYMILNAEPMRAAPSDKAAAGCCVTSEAVNMEEGTYKLGNTKACSQIALDKTTRNIGLQKLIRRR